jgi:hypothetical protein
MNYWQFKFKPELWEGFEKLETGDVFSTTAKENRKLSNRIGDIVFWYKIDNKKDAIKGIYFVSEIISEPKEDEDLGTGYSIDLRILKSMVNEPFILKENGFDYLIEKINAKNMSSSKYLFEEEDGGKELYGLLGVENIEKQAELDIDESFKNSLESIKFKNIENGKMFNPFLDMNLIKGEVKHVSFLANLLNPNGTHYHGELFLLSFLEILNQKVNIDELKNFNAKNANVITEKLTDTNKRIDLWIEDDNFIIAIEAKVESKDSYDQLESYNTFLNGKKKKFILIYLTKEGEKPINKYDDSLILISFKYDIKNMIENSLKTRLHPKVEITLNEYKNALLTHIYNLETTWSYSYDLLREMTKNEQIFQQSREIKNIYYRNKSRFHLTVIEDLASNFEKSKAKIELDFFRKIKHAVEALDDSLKIDSSCEYTNILQNQNDEIGEMRDINTVYLARRERVFYRENDYVQILYKVNQIEIFIRNDKEGLKVEVYKLGTDEIIKEKEICEQNTFSNEHISKLINKNESLKLINKIKSIINEVLLT